MKATRGLAALAAIGVVAAATLSGATGASARNADTGRSEHDRVVAFWTNERVARAIPRDFDYDPETKSFRPSAKPNGGGGGTGSTTTTLGSSWTAGGEVLKATGKVLFAMGGTYYVCSASVADDTVSGRSIILTAGHSAYDETNHAFATNWMFVPDYDSAPATLTTSGSFCAQTSLGCWTASALVVAGGFANAGGFNNQAIVHDYTFAMVGAGGKSGTAQLDSTVGGHPIQFSAVSGGADTYLFGYPAAGKYRGNDLVYCRGPLGFDPNVANATYRVGCNMTGGSSGGGWYHAIRRRLGHAGVGQLVRLQRHHCDARSQAQRRDAVDVRHGRVGDQQHDRSLSVPISGPQGPGPQRGAVGLARREQRDRVDHDDPFRRLEARDAAFGEPRAAPIEVETGCAHDERAHPLARGAHRARRRRPRDRRGGGPPTAPRSRRR